MKIVFFRILEIFFFACLLTACSDDFLDREPDSQMTEEDVFTRYADVNKLVTDLYTNIKMANRPLVFFDDFNSAAVTDECEGSEVEGSSTNKYNSGDWSPAGLPDGSSCGQYWWDLYAKIRKANIILDGIRRYQTPDDILEPGNLNKRIGEVYFMRAYLHYLVARMYGEVVYLDHPVDPNESMDFVRESFHATVEKICQDCDSAYARVPGKWGGSDFGRIDKGACLGLKAMTRWMAATPMWNGGDFPDDTRSFASEYASYDETRWDSARVAAKRVLDFQVNGGPRYNLYKEYGSNDFEDDAGQNNNNSKVYTRLWQMYYDMNAYEEEGVFFVTKDKSSAWQGDVYPPSWGGGSRQMPVQEQVDEYEYIAPDGYGYPVYEDRAKSDGYDDENPYESVQRDPRFYRDIIYHGATFKGNVINTATGPDKIGASNSTKTGYFLHKLLQESWNRNKSFDIDGPPVWRLPEFIYIYCEAVNNTTGPDQEIYDLLNEVRARSFMAPIPPAAKSDQESMNEYIQRERRVELFYENNRIWTGRWYLEPNNASESAKEKAWEAAGSDNDSRSQNYWPYPKCQRMINGMKPVEDPNGKIVIDGVHYKMKRFYVEPRVFITPRHYLWPIMNDELSRTPTLVQNPGW